MNELRNAIVDGTPIGTVYCDEVTDILDIDFRTASRWDAVKQLPGGFRFVMSVTISERTMCSVFGGSRKTEHGSDQRLGSERNLVRMPLVNETCWTKYLAPRRKGI